MFASRRLDDLEHRFGVALPYRHIAPQPPAAQGGQAVVLGATVVFREAPFGGDHAAVFETMERLIEGRILNRQDAVGTFANPSRDLVAVRRPLLKGSEQQ